MSDISRCCICSRPFDVPPRLLVPCGPPAFLELVPGVRLDARPLRPACADCILASSYGPDDVVSIERMDEFDRTWRDDEAT